MEYSLYAQGGLAVAVYDQSCPENGDIEFHVALAGRTGGPVLELGCGTGRVLWPVAEAGFEIVGLDLTPPMLELAEKRRAAFAPEVASRVRLVEADMADFELMDSFGFVFCTFRSFQALLTSEQQRSCLRCAHGHLKPGGTLAINVFDPHLDRCVDGDQDPMWAAQVYKHPESGNQVHVEALTRHNDSVNQVLTERWRFTETDAQGVVVRSEERDLSLRWTYRWEMRHLLELCGFEVEAEYSDFHGSPPAYGKEQVWVARRRD